MSRYADGYEPRFDIDNRYGHDGERLVGDVIQGMVTGCTEVKRDGMFHKTGNLYVEYECHRRDGWHKSGIATTEADAWAFVLGESNVVICIATSVLKEIARDRYRQGHTAEETNGSHPTRGVLIPAALIVEHARWLRQ